MSQIFVFLFELIFLLLCGQSVAKEDTKPLTKSVDICGQTDGIDLSVLDLNDWKLTHIRGNQTIDYNINICTPFSNVTTIPLECNNSFVCKHNLADSRVIAFQPKSVHIDNNPSNVRSVSVVYEGPLCEENPAFNYSVIIRFTCGPHLEYPKYFVENKCKTYLNWRSYAVCKERSVQNEVKCYVYDNNGLRRDLTPLIRPKEGSYKVLSANQDFHINVCSGLSTPCTENGTGACLGVGRDKYITVGDYRYSTLQFKTKSTAVRYEHIEMVYKTKSNACNTGEYKTTVRFICPPIDQRRGITFEDRNPKLVSNLDCDYQVEWFTEYACPVSQIESSPTTCELREDIHGLDFNLNSLLKSNENKGFYKIQNISIDSENSSLFDIEFNVCGGLGGQRCGDIASKSVAACLKSKNSSVKDKVIGLTSDGSLRLADNRFVLEYRNKDSDCKFGDNAITESTVIEFVCDQNEGNPEFVSFEDCVYNIQWKTPLVCPIISAKTSCVTTYNDWTFDLSRLRTGYGTDPWIAGVSQSLPWSRHSKGKNDLIFINICGLLPNTSKTKSCDGRSSACMAIAETNQTVNLGQFISSPKYNEDIRALEMVYENGFDERTKTKVKSKFTFRCKHGVLNSEPILVDIDDVFGIYEFEWETSAACPIDAFTGTNCTVFDNYLDYTFDLSPLQSKYPRLIRTDDYDFFINVCAEVNGSHCNASALVNAVGPVGVCQVEKKGSKRVFSLGKVSTSLTYWNGILNLTQTDGSTYNNPEKTPRKSEIAFICDPNAGTGEPEYDGERNRSYFFRWYTSLACPDIPKVVHCVWDNGSHIIDLTQLATTNGNTVTVGPSHSIYYINICRPLNEIHSTEVKSKCGSNSAVCRVDVLNNNAVLSLGEPTNPPISGFDGSINLFYANGSPCPTKPNENLRTRIKFICDPRADLSAPIVYEPGSEETESEECVYLFEWRTSAVCDVIEPTKLDNNSCVFIDQRTGLSVDLSPLRRPPSHPYRVNLRQNQSSFELNVCGSANGQSSPQCYNSAVCLTSNQTHSQKSDNSVINYGLLTSSSFFFDGSVLRLKYFNGSKCLSHSDSGMMSSEIIFSCNPDARDTEPKLKSTHSCIAVFEWETDLVCNLRLPKCSAVLNGVYYNLRQLSSVSHSWNTTDNDGNVYYINVCTKLPDVVGCQDPNAAVCLCRRDSNKKLNCLDSLGDPTADELEVRESGDLRLTYRNGVNKQCATGMKAKTQITFKCEKYTGSPKFISFNKQKCIYDFEWKTYIACPVSENNDPLVLDNGFLHDQRINAFINIRQLLTTTFKVKERREMKGRIDEYIYVINLNETQLQSDIECSKAAVCQTQAQNRFQRNIGAIDSIKYYLRGNELQIVLQSFGAKKCGKNNNKNVTTIFRLQCSSYSGLGEPEFMYESNDCDYTFNWETALVCPTHFIGKTEFDAFILNETLNEGIPASDADSSESKSSHSKAWIGIVIVVFFVLTITGLLVYKQRFRQSLMFRFRRLFGPETTNHTFHYHQLASHLKDRESGVVYINRDSIAAQPSAHVPYYSIYDESDVDLLI